MQGLKNDRRMGWLPRHGIAPGARGQRGNQIWAMYANMFIPELIAYIAAIRVDWWLFRKTKQTYRIKSYVHRVDLTGF